MDVRKTILWVVVALLIGVSVGFGFRTPIADVLNLNAQDVIAYPVPIWGRPAPCVPPKIWTGNGCADPNSWTVNDWIFFSNCLASAMDNPPPALPNHAITDGEYASCAKQTEGGKGR